MVWNLLPDDLRDSGCSSESFRCSVKSLLSSYKHIQCISGFRDNALYKFTIDTDIDIDIML